VFFPHDITLGMGNFFWVSVEDGDAKINKKGNTTLTLSELFSKEEIP
jgi:hypothetical protein